jgi:hypothetical protein
MCVTNTTQRRPVTLSASQLTSKPSELSQRICSSLFLGTELPAATTSTVPVKHDPEANQCSRRKRKPQKPGKTAKLNDRHFVIHNYHDHACDRDTEVVQQGKRRRGGVSVAFPMKLHAMLDQIEKDGLAHVISWQPHGRCFVVHKPKQFVDEVLQKYFKQSKMTSFQRQLNLYGFQRLTRGHDAGGYYHELFLRGKTFLCKQMTRTKVKGTGFKAASSPDQEPDFWRMAPVNPITPSHSDEDDSSTHSDSTASQPQAYCVPSFSPVQASHSIPTSFTIPDVQTSQQEETVDMSLEPIPLNAQVSDSDSEVLDEVVDELFLHEAPEENDNILDFVNTWNPHSVELLDVNIPDDVQLGLLLERILAE